ncbi:conserved hypothetical protein [Cupriavidus taiwanensis]|nr:conserved hypothetical protein [Cupriavidus taiwanensis]SOZ29842.1 conserved hypothetical protein [Cupriavidus taiwanensis]SOZ46959.1 conserved hypothetical protein [Cupriavidus taiwanensis]
MLMYNGNLARGPAAFGVEVTQNRVRPAGPLPRSGTQKQVRSRWKSGARLRSQKWVRRRNRYASESRCRDLRSTQKRVRFDGGFRRNGYASAVRGAGCSLGRALISAWITAWRHRYPPFLAGTGAPARLAIRFLAESGTLYGALPVEKPVGDGGYPRRIRFAPAADTGSGGRRYGFGPSLNRVRIAAESGSRGGDFPLLINGLGFTYTVYK